MHLFRSKLTHMALACTVLSGTALAADLPTGKGKYCDTPSRCDNPMAAGGMVTTPNYLASQAAIQTLRDGGNAVDAAIAATSVLAVVYPQMTTLGGDNFWLIYNAKTGELKALNASGRSGEKATIDFYTAKGLKKIPSRGYLAANTVPGVVSGWDEAWRYAKDGMGTKLRWEDLFTPAIAYAKDGFVASHSLAYWSTVNVNPDDQEFRNLQRFDGFRQTYLKADGSPYRAGEILKQPQLADTLSLVAQKGADEFYRGSISRRIVEDLQSHSGVLTLNDFAEHRANWVEPISVDYRQYRAYNFPPNT